MIRRICVIRTGYVNTSYHAGTYQSVRKYKDYSNIFKDAKCSLHFRTLWYMMKHPSDEKCGETARFVANACKRAERVSGILFKRESLPGANEVGGHDRGKHYLLST